MVSGEGLAKVNLLWFTGVDAAAGIDDDAIADTDASSC